MTTSGRRPGEDGEPVTIAFIAGTTAEIIKLAPVIRALEERGDAVELWNTAFHVGGLPATLEDLGLPQPTVDLVPTSRQDDVVRVTQVPGWVARVVWTVVRRRRELRRRLGRGSARPLVVVHGDTFSTVLGALLGRFLRVEVAHVEAGMRTGNIWHPMPEELNRRLVAKIATVHFAPTQHEVEHLRREGARGAIVDTGANTVIDALRLAIDGDAPAIDLPEEFGLVTLHRFEMLRNGPVFSRTLEVLAEASRTMTAGDAGGQHRAQPDRGARPVAPLRRPVPAGPQAAVRPVHADARPRQLRGHRLRAGCSRSAASWASRRRSTARPWSRSRGSVTTSC